MESEATPGLVEVAPSSERAKEQVHPLVPVAKKTVLTAVLLAGLLAVPYAHPALATFRVFTPKAAPSPVEALAAPVVEAVGEVKLPGETKDEHARARELEARATDARSPVPSKPGSPTAAAPVGAASDVDPSDPKHTKARIEDASGRALAPFFAKLRRVEAKEPGQTARILYYGDSIVGSDFVTGKLRRMLQSRFGDAGHGYALLANAWPGWFHLDVSRTASANWTASRVIGPFAEDGFYGLGGVSFQAAEPDAWSRFATVDGEGEGGEPTPWGRSVARFEIEYLAQPGGGDLAVIVDGVRHGTIATAAETKALRTHVVEVADGPHALEIRSVDARPVRAFGMRLERNEPGVTLSALGITGGRARFLDKADDAHWAEALRAAKPDLVVLAFGSNEIADGLMFPVAEYEATLRVVMRQIRAALPGASLMLVGPPDMASASEASLHTRTVVPVIVGAQKKLAAEEGWAFWDQYAAMGGAGSMWAWIKSGLGSADMFHPTGLGGNQLGTWQYQALMRAYAESSPAP